MNGLASFFGQRRWRAGRRATTSLALSALAFAQTPETSTRSEADTTAAPVVVPSANAAGRV